MPTRQTGERMNRACRIAPPLLALGLIAGCATTPEPETRPDQRAHPVLQELAGLLPGYYVTPARAGGGQRLALEVASDPTASPHELRLLMVQKHLDQPDQASRQFEWLLEAPDHVQDRLQGSFAPMDAAGRVQRRCSMQVNLRRDGLTAQTNPAECSFGQGDRMTGLLKEIAFDGTQLVIGDRLVSLPAGEPVGNDQVTRFMLSRQFSGWAGVRDGSDWRMASTIGLRTGQTEILPHDAAGMELGLSVTLNHYLMSRGERIKLRMTVSDSETGELLGEAWADADARSIGIALPDLQVGLESGD